MRRGGYDRTVAQLLGGRKLPIGDQPNDNENKRIRHVECSVKKTDRKKQRTNVTFETRRNPDGSATVLNRVAFSSELVRG